MAIWSRSKFFEMSRGYYKRSNNCFRITLRRVFKGMQYAYRDRKVKRREIRTQWIRSINAATRDMDLPYSRFVYGLNRSNMILDRKILADLAQNEPYSFKAVVDEIKIQVKIPWEQKETMTFNEALENKYLHFGDYEAKKVKDIEWRFAHLRDPKQPDWYGLHHPDFPHIYNEQRRKFIKEEQMKPHEMKKLPFTAYDDIPSEPDDE